MKYRDKFDNFLSLFFSDACYSTESLLLYDDQQLESSYHQGNAFPHIHDAQFYRNKGTNRKTNSLTFNAPDQFPVAWG